MRTFVEVISVMIVMACLIFGALFIASQVAPRSMQAIRMDEQTVQIMYTPSKPVYVTCYSNAELLECVDAPGSGNIIYRTSHMATEYTVKVYYQDGSTEEKRITVQVP
jgi:hypothetical protein